MPGNQLYGIRLILKTLWYKLEKCKLNNAMPLHHKTKKLRAGEHSLLLTKESRT
jgi:hypothetical protein